MKDECREGALRRLGARHRRAHPPEHPPMARQMPIKCRYHPTSGPGAVAAAGGTAQIRPDSGGLCFAHSHLSGHLCHLWMICPTRLTLTWP